MLLTKTEISFLQKKNEDKKLETAAQIFNRIGDPTCLKIISILMIKKEICVSDFKEILGLSMPAVSHQLRKLKSIGIVGTSRKGQIICYFLEKVNTVKILKKILLDFRKLDNGKS